MNEQYQKTQQPVGVTEVTTGGDDRRGNGPYAARAKAKSSAARTRSRDGATGKHTKAARPESDGGGGTHTSRLQSFV